MSCRKTMFKSVVCLFMYAATTVAGQMNQNNSFVIKLPIPPPKDSAGGIIVADVDNDGKMDYLVTVPGHLAVYDNDGKKL